MRQECLRVRSARRNTRRMTLRRLTLVALAALCASASLAPPASANTKRFGLTSFDRITVEGDMIVEIVPSNSIYAIADASRAALDTLSIEVDESRTLVVTQLAEGIFGPRRANNNDGPIHIRISAQNFTSVFLRGGGQVTITGMRGRDLRIDLNGAGSIAARGIDGETLLVHVAGSGSIALAGHSRAVTASLMGAGTIDAGALQTRDLIARANGTGRLSFAALTSADLFTAGSANISVAGRPRCMIRNTGAGTISCGANARANLPTSADSQR